MGTTWGDGWHPSASALGMCHTLGKGCRCGENEKETCGEIQNGIMGVRGDNWKGRELEFLACFFYVVTVAIQL